MDIEDIDLRDLIESETGKRFKNKYIECPFHGEKTPSLSVRFNSNKNKGQWKCFGCDKSGDAIDFIMQIKNISFREAREYLGIETEKTPKEVAEDKIKSYIEWQINNIRKGQQLIGLFPFTNETNEVIYWKAKFLKPDGKKDISYFTIKDDKVVNKRGSDEVPYNLYNTLKAISQNQNIVFVEGEKDANTINSILKGYGYVASSLKGVKNFETLKNKGSIKTHIIGDTGQAGQDYVWKVRKEFEGISNKLKIVNLPGINLLGDNKDVTDWIEAGHTKNDLLNAIDRSLDLKNKWETQQDKGGIWKMSIKGRGENAHEVKAYMTNFQILDAKRIKFIEEDEEGIKLIMKSSTGEIIERTGNVSIFDDTKSFKNFLGSMDLTFRGEGREIADLKIWINKYFAIETEELHKGVMFTKINGENHFICSDGAINSKGEYNPTIKTDTSLNVNMLDKGSLTKEELKKIKGNLLKFSLPEKAVTIVGTVINNLAAMLNQDTKEKLHHLLIVGESGSGKTTVIKNVVAPILNYPAGDIKSIGLITPFALIKDLSEGNYTTIYDEFKPSALDIYKIKRISETLRNSYDRVSVSRGDKSFQNKNFQLTRPLILAGEESYPNGEKALVERSAIVYLSKRERLESHTKAMDWIIENEEVINKFGKALIEIVLNMSPESYAEIRNSLKPKFKDFKNRILLTAINIATGIEIYNLLLEKYNIEPIRGYEKFIISSIKEEVLDEQEEVLNVVEQMLVYYNSLVEDGRIAKETVPSYEMDGKIYIKSSEVLNQLNIWIKTSGVQEVTVLKIRDFRKQAYKAGYIKTKNSITVRIDGEVVRADEYDEEMLLKIGVDNLIKTGLERIDANSVEGKIIQGVF